MLLRVSDFYRPQSTHEPQIVYFTQLAYFYGYHYTPKQRNSRLLPDVPTIAEAMPLLIYMAFFVGFGGRTGLESGTR